MSDLQCPCTILVVRHGETEYESPMLSDQGGSLTMSGRKEAKELADLIGHRNVRHIYASTSPSAVQTAEIAAASLGLVVTTREALRESSGAESGPEIEERTRDVLEAISDLHRGETVLVVSHGGVMSYALPRLVTNLRDDHAQGHALAAGATVELRIDADDWYCGSWPSQA